MIKKVFGKLPDILLAILISFSLTCALAAALCFTFPSWGILLVTTLITAVLYISFCSKKAAVAAGILFVTALIGCAVYILFYSDHEKLINFLTEYFYWLYDYIMYLDTPNSAYQFVTVLVLCLAASVFSFIFVIKKFRFLIVLAAGICIFCFQVSYSMTVSMESFYLFLAAALILYLKHVYMIKASKGLNDYTASSVIALWSIPVSIIIILLASLIHASDKPIQWEWLDSKIISAYNSLHNKFDYESFDYFSLSATSGFGDSNSLLGGRVRLDRTNVLQVRTNKEIYLRGVSKDLYTGSRWLNSVEELAPADTELKSLYSDTEEMLEGMKILTGEDDFLNKYFTETSVSVEFLNLKTKSLFIPSKISSIDFNSGSVNLYVSDTGDYSSEKRLKKGFEYSMKAYVPRIGSEEFINVLRKSKKGLYDEYLKKISYNIYMGNTVRTNPGVTVAVVRAAGADADIYGEINSEYQTVKELSEHSRLIYEKYTQLPEELPQRVKDLAASLVVSANNDYDKAKAIENYLAGKFAYNLDVSTTPRNRDFVDYFLFDLQEGYCTYFASAMTILARCAGLPARYVEGYMLPPEPSKDNFSLYIVSNIQAHAWTEIYFEGYGWLPFEPTAPFRSTFYKSDKPEQVSYSTGYSPSYEDYMAMMMKYYGQGAATGAAGFETGSVRSKPSWNTAVIISVSAVIGMFALLILFNVFQSKFRLFKLAVLPARESVVRHYEYYLRILRLTGFELKPSETPHQYSDRIDGLLYFRPVSFKAITDIFVRARYSMHDVTENEKQQFVNFVPVFLEEIKKDMGKVKYFTLKYILGRI